jgi:hypothetical protein
MVFCACSLDDFLHRDLLDLGRLFARSSGDKSKGAYIR